ncbi:MAG TPA: DUF2585 family protein [Candidatus Wallbacteria bacterium]|nr:DUF2585 family protein [Candidatus Wallbacteria bacterium]
MKINVIPYKYRANAIRVIFFILIVIITAAAEYYMGRSLFGPDGHFGFWEGNIASAENSQRLADPYSFTHFSHGLIFFAIIWFGARNMPVEQRFLIAAALEASWEILENSSFIIERYRAATVSLGYFGDSILNSTGDILAMSIGFWFAHKFSAKVSVTTFFIIEILLLLLIKDNLFLNVAMLIWPLKFIKEWQLSLP